MRVRTVLWAAAAIFAVTGVAGATVPRVDASPERRALEAIYARYVYLVKRDDKEGLVRFFQEKNTEDYVGKQVDGKTLTRDEIIAQIMVGPMAFTQLKNAEVRITRVILKGSEAIVDYTDRTTIHVPGPQGKPRKLEIHSTGRDTWLKRGTVWRCRLGETLSRSATLDGKPFKIRPQP